MMVIFLVGLVTMILMRTLRKDYARYAKAWLPDGYSWIFRIVCVWPFGLLDCGSATLRYKI